MEITEVRIKLMENSDDRLQAFCSITFDNSFAVRDLKIIEGSSGPFVAMPSRKLAAHCPRCHGKNHLRAAFCNDCGADLQVNGAGVPSGGAARESDGRHRFYADIAHPINAACREMIQEKVIAAYRAEREQSRQPGYVSKYEDTFHDDFDFELYSSPNSREEVRERSDERDNHSFRRASQAKRRSDAFGAGIF